MLTLLLVLSVEAPAERRAELARALGLLNSTSFMGAWVLNSGTGEIYFRITLPTRGARYDDDAIDFLVDVAVGTVDGRSGPIGRVIEGAPAESVLD